MDRSRTSGRWSLVLVTLALRASLGGASHVQSPSHHAGTDQADALLQTQSGVRSRVAGVVVVGVIKAAESLWSLVQVVRGFGTSVQAIDILESSVSVVKSKLEALEKASTVGNSEGHKILLGDLQSLLKEVRQRLEPYRNPDPGVVSKLRVLFADQKELDQLSRLIGAYLSMIDMWYAQHFVNVLKRDLLKERSRRKEIETFAQKGERLLQTSERSGVHTGMHTGAQTTTTMTTTGLIGSLFSVSKRLYQVAVGVSSSAGGGILELRILQAHAAILTCTLDDMEPFWKEAKAQDNVTKRDVHGLNDLKRGVLRIVRDLEGTQRRVDKFKAMGTAEQTLRLLVADKLELKQKIRKLVHGEALLRTKLFVVATHAHEELSGERRRGHESTLNHLDTLHRNSKEMQQEISSLRNERTEAQERVRLSERRLDTEHRALEALEGKVGGLEEDKTRLLSKQTLLEQKIESTQEEGRRFQERLSAISEAYQQKSTEVQRARGRLHESEGRLVRAREELAVEKGRVDDLETQISGMELSLRQKESQPDADDELPTETFAFFTEEGHILEMTRRVATSGHVTYVPSVGMGMALPDILYSITTLEGSTELCPTWASSGPIADEGGADKRREDTAGSDSDSLTPVSGLPEFIDLELTSRVGGRGAGSEGAEQAMFEFKAVGGNAYSCTAFLELFTEEG